MVTSKQIPSASVRPVRLGHLATLAQAISLPTCIRVTSHSNAVRDTAVFVTFLGPSKRMLGQDLKLRHELFLPNLCNPLFTMIHYSTLYIPSYDAVIQYTTMIYE